MSAPPNALGDASSATTDARRTEHLANNEQELARTELTALPVGIPLPSAIANLHAPAPATTSTSPSTAPTLHASSSSSSDSIAHQKNLRGEDAKVAAQLAAEREKLAPSTDGFSEKTTESISEKPKKKSFFSRRKAKDTEEKKGKQKEEELSSLPPVKLFALFRFATKFEIVLNIIGLILAAAAGAAQPLYVHCC